MRGEKPIIGYSICSTDLGYDCEMPVCINVSHAWLGPQAIFSKRMVLLPGRDPFRKCCCWANLNRYIYSGLARITMHKMFVIGLKD